MDKDFGPGIIVGFIIGVLITMLFMFDNISGQTAKAYGQLVKAGVPIVCTELGNFYMWSETTRTSIPLSSNSVRVMAGCK